MPEDIHTQYRTDSTLRAIQSGQTEAEKKFKKKIICHLMCQLCEDFSAYCERLALCKQRQRSTVTRNHEPK